MYHVMIHEPNDKPLWIKFWNVSGAFKDIWVFQDTKTSISDVKYDLPFTALIDAGVFPESQLKFKISASPYL